MPTPRPAREALEEIPPTSAHGPLAAYLLDLAQWSQGNRAESLPGLRALLHDRRAPGCWLDTAHYLLHHTPGEPPPSPDLPEHASFDLLALATYGRYELERLPPSVVEALETLAHSRVDAPLAPLFLLLLLRRADLEDLPEERRELLQALSRHYPGSRYDAHARVRNLRLMLPALQKLGQEIRQTGERERQIFLKERAVAELKSLDEELDNLLKRFAFQPEVRQELLRVADTVQETLPAGEQLRWLEKQVRRLEEYPEGADLHLRLVTLTQETSGIEDAVRLAAEHLRRFPQSPHREFMLFLRITQRLKQGDLPSALPMLRDLLASGHPRFVPLVQDELLRWLKTGPNQSPQRRIPLLEEIDRLPLDERHGSEIAYLLADSLKAQAARSSAREREALIAQLLSVLDRLEQRFAENPFTQLGRALRREIHDGSFAAAVRVNRLSNWTLILALSAWLAFYLFTFFQLAWLFWVQTVILGVIGGLAFVLHFILGIF